MRTKHTPGPWHATSDLRIRTKDGVNVSQCLTTYSTLNQSDANARLIAAAPDLLEAHDRILSDELFHIVVNRVDLPDEAKLRALLAEIYETSRIALAKARGEA